MKCLNKECKSKSLKGEAEFRSQDVAVTCSACKHINIVEGMVSGGYIHFKIDGIQPPDKPEKKDQEKKDPEKKKEDVGESKDGKKTGPDKK